ncbi:MAG: glycosyltransferase [Actinomycetes bacterium]
MRTLVVAELYPWPALDGYRRRLDHVVAGLASIGEVHVVAPLRAGDTTPAPPPLPNVTGSAVPTASDAGPRSWIRSWVTGRAPRRLLGVDWSGPLTELQSIDLDGFDLIWCSHVDTWWAVASVLGDRPVVVDFDNLENLALKLRRRIPPRHAPTAGVAEVASTLTRWVTSRAFDLVDERRWDALQRRCASSVSTVVVCSELDAQRAGVPNVAVVPNGSVEPEVVDVDRTHLRGDAPVLTFVGALDYEPNTEAVEWLVREIVPVLRAERHDATVRIVGRGADRVAWVGNVPGVVLVGEVADVADELARADVSIVPIRVGAGTRLKVVEAMAYRLPIVTTAVGCEGIDLSDGESALIVDDAVGFAAACARLCGDGALRQRLSDAAARRFAADYTWASIEARVGTLAVGAVRSARSD